MAVDDLVDDLAGELRALGRAGWGVTPRHTSGPAGRFAGLLSTEVAPSHRAKGTWMHDALDVRDKWESRLLRTTSWSPWW